MVHLFLAILKVSRRQGKALHSILVFTLQGRGVGVANQSFSLSFKFSLTQEERLFFRGQLIWKAIMEELLSAGMSGAKQVTS